MKNAILWTLQITAALAILVFGAAMIGSLPVMVEAFAKIGVGPWLRYLVGGVEMAAALALLVEGFATFAAGFLAYLMAATVIAQLSVTGGDPFPAFLLFIATAAIALGRLVKSGYLSTRNLTY
jgi:putative oxidoreductase